MRIIVAGGPRTGKTTLADRLGRDLGMPVRHTDDLIDSHSWSEASEAVSGWCSDQGPWVIEGVAAARALRKWLVANEGAPCDVVKLLFGPYETLTRGQETMAKGCLTVWNEIEPELRSRGVVIDRLT